MDSFIQDLRHALRKLRNAPGFALVAILTLALGIGANTAIFSVVDAVLLRPLPFANEERLVSISSETDRGGGPVSGPDFLDFREQNQTFEGLAAHRGARLTVGGAGEPERLQGRRVSANFFRVLGAAPARGRAFTEGEDQPGAARVALLSHGLWQDRFGGDPQAMGQTIRLDGEPHEIVGIMPPGFDFPYGSRLWVPLVWENEMVSPEGRGNHSLQALGLLKPGVTIEQGIADLQAIAKRLEAEYPQSNTGFSATAISLREQLVGDVRPALLVLLGAVGFVLLIACANVANLLLARAAGRQGEISLRLALGAGRARIIRQLLVESAVLAITGAGAGLLLAAWGLETLRALGPEDVPRLSEVGIDGRVLLFTAVLSLATAFLFGLFPALQTTRQELSGSLREVGRSGRASARSRARDALIVSETALAVVLLLGAGLLLKSFVRLQQVDPGFRAENVLAVDIALPPNSYEWGSVASGEFYDRLLERVRTLPGVQAAGGSFLLPLTGSSMISPMIDQGRPEPEPGQAPLAQIRIVTPGYAEAMGIRLVRGRLFGEQDRGTRAVLISEEAARRYYPGEDPVGRTVEVGVDFGSGAMGGTIIGVVGGVRHEGLAEDVFPEIYIPFEQGRSNDLSLVIRTAGDPTEVTGAVRSAVRELDKDAAVGQVRTLETILGESVAQPRFYALLLGIFSAIALVLAAIGIYGVVANAVTHRMQEFGIRMALGANGGELIRMVLKQYMVLTAVGLALGLGLAFAASRVLSGMLYGVEATDPLTFVAVPGLLGAVAMLASFLPALRATRADPVVTLRQD